MSNSILLSSYPFLRTCYTAYAHGVPSVKIRVSTLTASEYNTVTSGGVYTAFMGKTTPTPGIKAAPGPAAKALIPSTTTSPPKLAITSFLQAPDVPQSSQAVSHIANEPESPEPSKENEPEIPGPSKDKGPEIPEPSKNNEPESPGPFKNNEPGNPGSSQDNEPKIPEPSKNGTQNEPSRIQEAPLQNQRPNPANPPGEKLSPQEDSPAPKAVQNQPSAARRPEPKNSGPRIESAESPPKVTGGPNNPGGMSLPTIPLAPNAKTATSRNPSKTDSSDHPLPVIKIGNDIIIAQAASHYIIGSQTLAPGGPIITANNIKYSLAPSATALIVGSQTLLSGGPAIHIKGIPYSLASLTASGDSTVEVDAGNNEPPVLSIAGFAATADSNSNYHVGAQTLAPGSVGITVNGVLYSLAPSATALVSGSSTIALNSAKDKLPSLTIAGATVTANSASNYIIGTQTLVPGAPGITVNGALYSLAPSATALVSGSSTIPLTSGSSDLPNSITIGGSTYTANSASQYIIGSQTLVPGGHPITVSGATYSLSPSATALISNGITVPIPLRTSLPFVITIDGTGYRGNSDSGYVIGSQTLFPNGSPISINATPYSFSLGSSGGALIIGTSTSFLFSAQATQPPQVITLGSSLYTENPSSGFIIGEQTLAPGSAITVDGTAISLGAEGTNLVVGSTTESINLGSLILSAFGGEPTDAAGNPSGGDVAGFTGEANVRSSAQNILWLILVVMLFSMM